MIKKNLKLILLFSLVLFIASSFTPVYAAEPDEDPCDAYVEYELVMEMANAGDSYTNPYADKVKQDCKDKYAADKAKREGASGNVENEMEAATVTTGGEFKQVDQATVDKLKKEASSCYSDTRPLMKNVLTVLWTNYKDAGSRRERYWTENWLEALPKAYTKWFPYKYLYQELSSAALALLIDKLPLGMLTPEDAIDPLNKMLKENYAQGDAPLISAVKDYITKASDCAMKASKISGLDSSEFTDLYSWTSPDGKQTVLFRKDGGNLVGVGGVLAKCVPLMIKLGEAKQCKFCPLFNRFYQTAQKIASNSYAMLASNVSYLVIIALALYIAFKFLPYMASFTKQEAPKVLSDILVQAGKTLFVWFLLEDSSFVYQYFVGPVLSAGLDFGTKTLSDVNATFSCGEISLFSSTDAFPPALFGQINCFVQRVQQQLGTTESIGSTMMCVARNAGQVPLVTTSFGTIKFWNFTMMFNGLLLYIFSWLITFAFGFYLLDAVARLCIIGALMPLLIGCWTFGITRSYTQKGWSILMHAFFTFVFMGLVISVVTQLMILSISGTKGGTSEVIALLNSDNIQGLHEMFDVGFSGFLVLLASCVIGFKLIGQTENMAGQWSGGGGFKGIGAQIGGMAASAVKTVAKAAATVALGGAAGAAGGAIGGKAGAAVKQLGSRAFGTQKGIAGVANRAMSRAGGKTTKAIAKGAGAVGKKVGNTKLGRGVKAFVKGFKAGYSGKPGDGESGGQA